MYSFLASGYAFETFTTEKPSYFSIENPFACWILFLMEVFWFAVLSDFLHWIKPKNKIDVYENNIMSVCGIYGNWSYRNKKNSCSSPY